MNRPGAASSSRLVFLDSSGLFALANAADAWHPQARAAWLQLTAERWQAHTTNFVIAEAHALFLALSGRADAAAFLRQMVQGPATVVRAGAADESRARAIIFQYTDKDFSLTDAISFAVMERLGIGVAFSFDRDFAQYGFRMLGPTSGS